MYIDEPRIDFRRSDRSEEVELSEPICILVQERCPLCAHTGLKLYFSRIERRLYFPPAVGSCCTATATHFEPMAFGFEQNNAVLS